MAIKEFQNEYRFLSNFWPEGDVERQYQAAKFKDYKIQAEILNSKTPGEAKRLAKKYKDRIREDWDEIKLMIMLNLLEKKFSIPSMREKLLATGNAVLQEGNRWGDTFWGVDLKTGKGRNWLGCLLMKVRWDLKRERKDE